MHALASWGRFQPAKDLSTADLVITIRKGSGRAGGMADSNDSPMLHPASEASGGVSGIAKVQPMSNDPTSIHPEDSGPQSESGPTDDTFTVFRGKHTNAIDSHAVWRYSARNALDSPAVPAVDEFKRVLLETEKQQETTP